MKNARWNTQKEKKEKEQRVQLKEKLQPLNEEVATVDKQMYRITNKISCTFNDEDIVTACISDLKFRFRMHIVRWLYSLQQLAHGYR